MHVVNLQVVASVRIKRKKPWKRLAWIGKLKESVLLLEDHRVSVLFIPSGNTKRKIAKLSPIVKDCVSLNYTQDGSFVFGLLQNGTIFTWDKDTNCVSHIPSIPDLQTRSIPSFKWRPFVFMDDFGHHAVTIVLTPTTTTEIFVWKKGSSSSGVADRWWRIDGSNVDSRSSKDVALDVCFARDETLGRGARCGFVFTRGTYICFVALNVKWPTNRLAPIVHRWSSVTFPFDRISSTARPSKRKGSYVVRWSRDACMAAIIVNQEAIEDGRILFVSVNCEVLVVSRIYVDDVERYDDKHLHWICDVAWTNNDLFLVTVNRLGSVCLVSRLGEPLTIGTQGCSMDLSPSRSLSIHPFVFVRNSTIRNDEESITTTSNNVLKQRFSVCCHPRSPVFLCSDGYLVTCLQLPTLLTDPHRAVYVFLREAQKSLKQLKKIMQQDRGALATTSTETPVTTLQIKNAFRRSLGLKEPPKIHWEEPQSEDTDTSVDQSSRAIHRFSTIGNETRGVLSFGTFNSTTGQNRSNGSTDVPFSDVISDAQKETLGSLFNAWSIVVTTCDTWTIEWETRAKNVTELLIKLCSMYGKQMISIGTMNRTESICSPIDEIIAILDRFLLFCRFDGLRKNTMPVVIGVVRTVFGRVLLSAVQDLPPEMGFRFLDAITALLCSVSDTIISTFSWNANKLILYKVGQSSFEDVYSATSIGRSVQKSCSASQRQTLGSRLISIWRRLYRVAKRIYRNLDSTSELVPILGRIQIQIQLLGQSLQKADDVKVTAEQKHLLLIPNDRDKIIEKWWQDAEKVIHDRNSTRKATKLLHSILYSYLEYYQLEDVVSFIHKLVAFERNLGLRHRAVRLVVRSLARFMSLYFMGAPLTIYPWHHPRLLGCSNGRERSDRFIHLHRDCVVKSLRDKSVSDQWSASVCIALLLSTGCLNEASDLARYLGDWKSSFVVSVANSIVLKRQTSETCFRFFQSHVCKLLGLEEGTDFRPSSVVLDAALPSALEDCLLAGVLCGLDIVPSICENLLNELKVLVRQLDSVLVPEEIYVPRPPIYCPQLKDPVVEEDHIVARIASILHLVCIVLCSSHCHVHVVRAYLTELSRISQMLSFDNEPKTANFPLFDMLLRLEDQIRNCSEPTGVSSTDLNTMVQCFRDICSVSWFMNVRDKASRYFRKFRQSVEAEKISKAKVMSKNCSQVLQWAFHLFPFVEFMDWNLEVYNLMLSVLMEMPADEKASAVLAKLFPDMTEIPDELNYRINRLLSVWRTSAVETRGGSRNDGSVRTKRTMGIMKTLSVIHLEQCQQTKNDAIHLNVAVGPLERNVLVLDEETPSTKFKRVRPYEIEKDYYEFLELMFDVGFLKDGISTTEVPLFASNMEILGKRHLSKLRPTFENRKKVVSVDEMMSKGELPRAATSTPKKSSKSGLFRSLSLSDLQIKTFKTGMPSSPSRTLSNTFEVNLSKGKSLTNLNRKARKATKKTLVQTPCENRKSEPVYNMLSLCEAFSSDQYVTIIDDRKENLMKLLTWLVRWAESDDRAKRKRSKGPCVKVHLSAAQLLSPIWRYKDVVPTFKQTDDGVSTGNLDSISSSWSPTEVTPRDFLTSTPVHDSIPGSVTLRYKRGRKNEMEESWSKSLQSPSKQHNTGDDLISDYFNRLRLYQDYYDDSSTFDSSTFDISSLQSDVDKSSLFTSLKSVNKSSKYDEPSLVTVTSRWTNSNRTESKPRVVSSGNVGKLTSDDQLDIGITPASKPAFKDAKKTSHLIHCAVQVHETSLLESRSSVHDTDDTLNEISSPDTATSSHSRDAMNQSGLVRRDAVKRSRRKPDEKPKKDGKRTDSELKYVRVPLLKLPAEKELCLIDAGMTSNMRPRTRKNIMSSVNHESELPSRPNLLHLEKSQEEPVLSMRLLSQEELMKYGAIILKRSKSSGGSKSKPPVPPKPLKYEVNENPPDVKITSIEKHKQPIKVDVGVGSSSSRGYVRSAPIKIRDVHTNTEDPTRDVQTNTEDKIHEVRVVRKQPDTQKTLSFDTNDALHQNKPRDISTNTENHLLKEDPPAVTTYLIPVKESKSVGVATTNGFVTKEDKATSPIVSQNEQRQANGEVSHADLRNHRKTQTESKKSYLTRDSQTEPESKHMSEAKFSIEPDKVTTTSLAETTKTTDDETVDDSAWKYRLNGAGRNVYRKIELMDSDAKMIKSELNDTKKFLERLELLERSGLLSKQFPCDAAVQDAIETAENRSNESYEQDEEENDDAIHRSDCSRNVEVPDDKQKQHDVVKSELQSWMKRKSSERRKEFREKMAKFRALEREPFVLTGKPVTDKMIFKSREERIERNKDMAITHFQARTDEALRLLRDLVQDKVPSMSTAVARPTVRDGSLRSKSSRKEAANDEVIHNRTYILDRGLIPVKSFKDEQQMKTLSKLGRRPPTAFTRKPTSHIERLHLKSLHEMPRKPTVVDECALSRSSSCDTISAWSLPNDVRSILYGRSSHHIQVLIQI